MKKILLSLISVLLLSGCIPAGAQDFKKSESWNSSSFAIGSNAVADIVDQEFYDLALEMCSAGIESKDLSKEQKGYLYLLKGVAEHFLHLDSSCEDLHKASKMGDKDAKAKINLYCNSSSL